MPDLNLYQRLAAAIADCPPIEKDTSIAAGKSSYKATTFDGAISKIRPVLIKHGIVFSQEIIEQTNETYEYEQQYGNNPAVTKVGFLTYVHVRLTFINIDNPEERIISDGVGTGMDSQDKAAGKALTYARKNALLAILMTSTGENDEERPDHEATRATPARKKTASSKSGGAVTDAQVKMIHAVGHKVYGDKWDDHRHHVLGAKGLTSLNELSSQQASAWIDQLKRKEEEDALKDMGV